MTVSEATKKLLEASGMTGEKAKDFVVMCYANLFVTLSEQYGTKMQNKLLNAAIKRTKEIQ